MGLKLAGGGGGSSPLTLTPWLAGRFTSATVVGWYFLTPGDGAIAETADAAAVPVFHLDDADYAVTGKTTNLRVRATCLTNATAPGASVVFTVRLVPVASVAGGAGVNILTTGVAVAASAVAFANPSLSTTNQSTSGSFAFPADGYYALMVQISGANPAANSASLVSAQVQVVYS